MKFVIHFVLLVVFCSPALSSRISNALENDWESKRFRKLVRSERKDLGRVFAGEETYLHLAAKLNSATQLSILLDTPLKELVGATNSLGQTPIEVAIKYGSLEAFLVLLKHYDINHRFDDEGWTLAHLAAWYDEPDILRALHERGANMKARDRRIEEAQTPIEVAIMEGCVEAFLVLLEYYDLNHRFGERGWTLAHLAAWHNQPDMLRALHRAGAVMNARDRSLSQMGPLEAANLAGAGEAATSLLDMVITSPRRSQSFSKSRFSYEFIRKPRSVSTSSPCLTGS